MTADPTYPSTFQTRQDGNAVVPTGKSLDIESGGSLSLAGTAITATAAQINQLGSTAAFTTRVTTTDGVTSGTARVVGGRAYTNTAASTAITNTITETLFDTQYSIPANTLKAGTLVRIRYQGIATATNSTDTLAVKLYIGGLSGTALISHAATDVANNDVFSGEMSLICRDAGATGHIVGAGSYKSVPAAAGTATYKDAVLASTVIDTTAAQVVGVSATWSVANAGNSCRLDFLSVEIL